MVHATQIMDLACDMARGMLCFGIHQSFTIARCHYENIDLATMSQGLTPIYPDAELDDIEKEVATLAHDLSTKIEIEIIPQGVSLVR